jgi:Fe-S-cluster-containing dehydrogenase component/CRP-like cAMP-binding protein
VSAQTRPSQAWPLAVWDSPWLRGIDRNARAAVEAAGRLKTLEKGARIYGVSEPADAFFVVGEGVVDVRAVRRGEQQARSIRRAVAGDALGEEAIVRAGVARSAEATCATRVVVAEVPVAVFRRAAGRASSTQAAALEEPLRRAAARDVLRSSSLARALPERELEALVASAEHRTLARGEVLFACGDPGTHAYLLADGMVKVEDGASGGSRAANFTLALRTEPARIRAYLSRGDLVADGALESGGAHDVTVVACGAAWVVALPRQTLLRVARRSPEVLADARRLLTSPPPPEATRHVLGDLWRFAEAGSMLVIDDEACVRCGHCAWSCADAHGDGVSRLVRRGEKVLVRDAEDGQARALVIPGSCQHCKHPACMLDCPTGAIGRDSRGDVFVREDLCVGCARCVTACPWGSVQMAPRAEKAKKSLPMAGKDLRRPRSGEVGDASSDVAVKCDMCRDLGHGPACVSACPVDAIVRIEPLAALVEVRDAMARRPRRRGLPRRRAAWPWVLGAAACAAAVVRVQPTAGTMRMGTGAVAGLVVVALAGYAIVKRTRLGRGPSEVSRVRPHAIAHMALGTLALGIVLAHVGARVAPNAAGALLVAFAVASATGIASALAYRLVPRALSRVERSGRLAEDLPARARDLDDRAFGALTGRSDATKAVYARWLAPYAKAPLGALVLVASGKTLRDEEKRLRGWVERVLGERHRTLDGLDDLVRMVVERRALRAQVALQALLQIGLPAHVIAVAVTLVLLLMHIALVTRGR